MGYILFKDYKEAETIIVDKIEGKIDVDWSEIVDMLDLTFSPEHLRKLARGIYESYKYYTSAPSTPLETKLQELKKERYKIQTEKLELNRWLREDARDELIIEHLCKAISELKPPSSPPAINVRHNDRAGILIFGDEHFGSEFEIRGLKGEIINAYSPEIFEQRMWELLYKTIEIVRKENLDKIKVFSMGDFQDGILRVSQLMKLRYGVVEGTVEYADFITRWLNKLSEEVVVEFQIARGNHTELRMLGQPKGTFKNENMSIVVERWIEKLLEDNPNFEFVQNPTGLIFSSVLDFNILGIHGEVRNMAQAIKDFSSTYKTSIDFLIAGHKHHSCSENVGIASDVINVPSIIGVDDYSMSLNKTSDSGATFIVLEKDIGKTIEYSIKLR